MTENSKSQAKLNEANTNLAVLDQQLTDYKAYLKEAGDEQDDNSVWSLPTINQAWEVYRYHIALQNILTAMFGITFNWGVINTCQSYSASQSWRVNTLIGNVWYDSNKADNYIVIAISNK